MNKLDVRLAKHLILTCLTTDFEYGRNKRTGLPLKRKKKNQALFDRKEGWQVYGDTNLEMVMEAVVLGLYLALDGSTVYEDE